MSPACNDISGARHCTLVTVNDGRVGGMQKFSRFVARTMLDAGWRVTIACCGDDIYEDLVAAFPIRCAVDHVNWVDKSFAGDREYGWSRIRHRSQWFKRTDPDVVLFVQSSNTPFRASMFGAKLAGIPVVTTHRTLPYTKDFTPSRRYFFGLVPGLGQHRKRMVMRTWLTSLLASRVVYNSRRVGAAYQRLYRYSSGKGCVIHNAVDTPTSDQCPPLRDTGTVTIGYAGRLGHEKRVDILLRAVSQLGGRRDVRVMIYGCGPEEDRLKALAAELGIGDRVAWAGETNDIWSAYSRMDIVALCSSRESSSNMVLEAMAAGRAVVVADVGGLPELVGDGRAGRIVPPEDIGALAATLSRLVDDAEDRLHIGRSARVFVADRHASNAVARAWLDLLSDVARCNAVVASQSQPGHDAVTAGRSVQSWGATSAP